MVVHSLLVGLHTDDYKTEIRILEDEEDVCIIINDLNGNELESYLSLKELHSFIGTLLHVQQKLKNK
jgi:hypothetical protein